MPGAEQLNTSQADRILGALYGLACGDALGATLEFLDAATIRAKHGPGGLREIVGGGWLNLRPGETTDDTDMTLCVAEGIAAAGPDAPTEAIAEEIGRRFGVWLDSHPPDVGATVAAAILAYRRLGSWDAATRDVEARFGPRAAGNGALMRALPVSFPWRDPDRIAAVSRAVTRLTHPTATAEWCSLLYNLAVRAALDGMPADRAVAWAGRVLPAAAPDLGDMHRTLWRRVARAHRLPRGDVETPSGYCVDTLVAALWAVLGARTAEDAIVRAANLGGDADTVAAVAGGLAGAVWGAAAIPSRWLARLEPRNRLAAAAKALA